MSYFLCKCIPLNDKGEEISDEIYYVIEDGKGNVIAGPFSSPKEAQDFAQYLNI